MRCVAKLYFAVSLSIVYMMRLHLSNCLFIYFLSVLILFLTVFAKKIECIHFERYALTARSYKATE